MEFIGPLFGALEQGFGLWKTKEGNKYRDEIIQLRQERADELIKPEKLQSDLTLISIEQRLLILYETFVQYKPDASN